jgi:hypothetical protein
MLSDFCRFYPAYTVEKVKRELTREQFNALLEAAYKRPWGYSVMVEPKER